MGFGSLIMIFPEIRGFFTLKHKTELDKTFEKFNMTPQQTQKRRKVREFGAFVFALGLILTIIGVFGNSVLN